MNLQLDERTQFVVSAVAKAVTHIRALGGAATEVVAYKPTGYKDWDPETIKVDREAEDVFISEVEKTGWNAVLLSEELMRKEFKGSGELVYVISDPFDGSLLYKRQIPAFWFTSLAVYSEDGAPLACAVGDVVMNTIDFCDGSKSYTASIVNGELSEAHELKPSTTTNIEDAFLETYLMKPKFLYPCVELFKPLFSKVKFVLPNGGPAGFCDVAKGRVDIYFAYRQPMIEIFSGAAIAQKAGCTVTTLDGEELTFDEDINKLYDVLCCCTSELHENVLAELRKLR